MTAPEAIKDTHRRTAEKYGYTVEKEQKAKARLLYMTNFRMTKAL